MASVAKRERQRYRITCAILLTLLVLYLALVANQERVMGRSETFPFASWSLFSMVPNIVNDYSVRIIRIGDEQLKSPIWYEQSGDRFPSARENGSRSAIRELGLAIESHNQSEIDRVRNYFEALHLAGHGQVEYELTKRQWETLERFNTGKIRDVTTLAKFKSTNEPRP
jgi:hypothetical protein